MKDEKYESVVSVKSCVPVEYGLFTASFEEVVHYTLVQDKF
jgi:hypothetical protein